MFVRFLFLLLKVGKRGFGIENLQGEWWCIPIIAVATFSILVAAVDVIDTVWFALSGSIKNFRGFWTEVSERNYTMAVMGTMDKSVNALTRFQATRCSMQINYSNICRGCGAEKVDESALRLQLFSFYPSALLRPEPRLVFKCVQLHSSYTSSYRSSWQNAFQHSQW